MDSEQQAVYLLKDAYKKIQEAEQVLGADFADLLEEVWRHIDSLEILMEREDEF